MKLSPWHLSWILKFKSLASLKAPGLIALGLSVMTRRQWLWSGKKRGKYENFIYQTKVQFKQPYFKIIITIFTHVVILFRLNFLRIGLVFKSLRNLLHASLGDKMKTTYKSVTILSIFIIHFKISGKFPPWYIFALVSFLTP